MSSSESNFSVNSTSEYDINNAQIASGNLFELALKPDGTVWSWGNNSYGQLGNGNIANEKISQPNQVLGVNGEGKLSNIKQISAGESFAIALTDDGKVLAWGQNTYGQLGNNTNDSSGVPVYVQDENGKDIENIKQISAGSFHGLAVSNDGTVYSWGLNSYGQLGLGNKSSYTTPTLISSISDVSKISAGYNHAVALNKYGEVYVWGSNSNGQLGLDNIKTTDEPIKLNIPGTKIVDISAGKDYTALIDNKGRVYISGNTTNIVGVNYENFAVIKDFVDIVKVACGDELVGINKDGNVVKINNNKISIKFSNVQDLNRILEIMNIDINE